MDEASLIDVQLGLVGLDYLITWFHAASTFAGKDVGSGGRRRSQPLLILSPTVANAPVTANIFTTLT